MYSDDTLAYVALKVKGTTCSFIPVEFLNSHLMQNKLGLPHL